MRRLARRVKDSQYSKAEVAVRHVTNSSSKPVTPYELKYVVNLFVESPESVRTLMFQMLWRRLTDFQSDAHVLKSVRLLCHALLDTIPPIPEEAKGWLTDAIVERWPDLNRLAIHCSLFSKGMFTTPGVQAIGIASRKLRDYILSIRRDLGVSEPLSSSGSVSVFSASGARLSPVKGLSSPSVPLGPSSPNAIAPRSAPLTPAPPPSTTGPPPLLRTDTPVASKSAVTPVLLRAATVPVLSRPDVTSPRSYAARAPSSTAPVNLLSIFPDWAATAPLFSPPTSPESVTPVPTVICKPTATSDPWTAVTGSVSKSPPRTASADPWATANPWAAPALHTRPADKSTDPWAAVADQSHDAWAGLTGETWTGSSSPDPWAMVTGPTAVVVTKADPPAKTASVTKGFDSKRVDDVFSEPNGEACEWETSYRHLFARSFEGFATDYAVRSRVDPVLPGLRISTQHSEKHPLQSPKSGGLSVSSQKSSGPVAKETTTPVHTPLSALKQETVKQAVVKDEPPPARSMQQETKRAAKPAHEQREEKQLQTKKSELNGLDKPPYRPERKKEAEPCTATKGATAAKKKPSDDETEKKADDENGRVAAIREIILSEQIYDAHLQVLIQHFIDPLVSDGYVYEDSFANLTSIAQFHRVFARELQCPGAVPRAFTRFAQFLKIYTPYINGYEQIMAILGKLSRESSAYNAFLASRPTGRVVCLEDGKPISLLSFMSYLIMPVQRIPRYVLLLTELKRRTASSHPDYNSTCSALALVQKIATHVNEQKRRTEDLHKQYGGAAAGNGPRKSTTAAAPVSVTTPTFAFPSVPKS